MKDKVKIIIEKGKYADSHKDGCEYISVDYSGRIYGGASPCDNEEEVKSSIAHAKKRIIEEGDIPIVEDMRNVIASKQVTLF